MPDLARVHYHVHKDEQQAFVIDPDGVAGALIAPETVECEVRLADVRRGETEVDFLAGGIAFVESPTRVTGFDPGAAWQDAYETELRALLAKATGVAEAVLFDHTIRTDDPRSERRPARHVHSDYSEQGAVNRLAAVLGDSAAEEWSRGHFAFANVWRPIGDPVRRAPLGFIRADTVADDEWIPIDLVYPDRRGQVMGLAQSKRHEWLYWSAMTPANAVIFNIYDNRGRRPVPHSAVDLVHQVDRHAIRKSIESRAVIRFA